MPDTDDDFIESMPAPPEVKACLRVIFEYQEGRLSLEDAAPRLQVALRANPHGLNMDMGPRLRTLLAEVAKLEGTPLPPFTPDPERHKSRGQHMLHSLKEKAWSAIEDYPGELHRFRSHFEAATEEAARILAQWLADHGHENVTVRSPQEADADDWTIYADTPTVLWTKHAVEQWADSIRSAPLRGEASFTGWSMF